MRSDGFKLPTGKRRDFLKRATVEYAESVALAMDYLTGRGLDEDTADWWQLGYVLDPLPEHERFKGYLSVPYLTRSGTVHMKFRCIRGHDCSELGHGKYDTEPDTGTRLFGAQSFWIDSPLICITEGEMDAISAGAAGMPAVAVPGRNTWREHMAYCFEGYEEVLILADGDEAGRRLASNVGRALYNSRVVAFPDGEDVNSFLVKHGPEALRERCGVTG